MGESAAKRAGVVVPERFIPTPTTISPQAQAFLSSPMPVGRGALPELDDIAGWRAYIAEHAHGLEVFAARLAQRFPADVVTHQLSNAALYEVTPATFAPDNQELAILFVHGGGFIVGAGGATVTSALPLASTARTRTFCIDYRMPPDHPFPAGLNDVVEAYRFLLDRYAPERIGVYGASAGGSLGPAAVLAARDAGLPLPAACALHSPATDATESGDTYETNAEIDFALRRRSPQLYALYAGGHDLRDPLISPVFGDFTKGFPPTILTSGTRDLLLSSTVLLHRALRRAGLEAELHVWEAMAHVLFFDAPEEEELYAEQVAFLLRHMSKESDKPANTHD